MISLWDLKMELKNMRELLQKRGESLCSVLEKMEMAIEEQEERFSEEQELTQGEDILNGQLTQRTLQRSGERRKVKKLNFKKAIKRGNNCEVRKGRKIQQKREREDIKKEINWNEKSHGEKRGRRNSKTSKMLKGNCFFTIKRRNTCEVRKCRKNEKRHGEESGRRLGFAPWTMHRRSSKKQACDRKNHRTSKMLKRNCLFRDNG